MGSVDPLFAEAVIALEAMGRVSVKTGSGVYVLEGKGVAAVGANVSPFELLETRVLIEGEAAALAASMINDEQIVQLQQALEEMARENEAANHDSDVADRKFHAVIAAATSNRLLTAMIENLWDVQEGLHHIRAAHNSVCKEDPETRLREHQAIYDALAARDSQAARIAMRNHFGRGINALHQKTEQEAVEAVQRQLSETRERFLFEQAQPNLVAQLAAHCGRRPRISLSPSFLGNHQPIVCGLFAHFSKHCKSNRSGAGRLRAHCSER